MRSAVKISIIMASKLCLLPVSSILFHLITSLSRISPADAMAMHLTTTDMGSSSNRCKFDISLKTADCHELGLKAIPGNLSEDTEKLNLKSNYIPSLLGSSFKRYPFISHLDLSVNELRVIESTAFHPLKDLYLLYMSFNPQMVLPAEGLLRFSSKLTHLDLSYSDLNFLPHDILKWSERLDEVLLHRNKLTFFNISLCGTVGTVSLFDNHIDRLTKDTFSFPCQADKLSLTGNPIQSVDPSVIASLHIRSLDLGRYPVTLDVFEVMRNISIGISGSKIQELAFTDANLINFPPYFFEPMRNSTLSTLDFSENRIKLYPSVFSSLRRVHMLNLRNNFLKKIEPDFFEGMHQIKVLELTDCMIEIINSINGTWGIGLMEMHLARNSLSTVSDSTFRGLHNLRLLDLSENEKLSILFPNSFSGLERINTIKLSWNNIAKFNMVAPSLKSLYLDNMGFDIVSPMEPGLSFKHSKLLKNLTLRNSHLTISNLWDPNRNISLFDGLYNLTTLDLSKNKVSNDVNELQPGIFKPLSALEILNLEQCNLLSIHPLAFSGLQSLQLLNLKGNKIEQLHSDFLKDLGQMKSINLADNNLAYLDKVIFSNNKELTTLLLSNNKLTSLNQSSLRPVESCLSSIDLSDNPIVCDCDLSWLLYWLRRPVKLLNENTTVCSLASLNPLRGKRVVEFYPSEFCGLNIALVCLSSVSAISLVGIIILCHHYRWQLRHKLFLLKLAVFGYMEIQDAREHTDFEFDLNIIFYEEDEEWVREHLRLTLEERLPQFQRKVFGDGDLIPGMHYLEAVDYVVTRSYKTIVLLSRAAVSDRLFMLKLRTAMDHVSDTQTEFVVLVFLEDIPDDELPFLARLYLSDGRPYLHWPEDVRGHEYFFDELTKHLTINLRTNDLIPNA